MRDLTPAARHLFRTPGEWGLRPAVGEHRHGNVHFEVLAVFDHDHEGTHALVQAWDHSHPWDGTNRWRFFLWQSYHVTQDWPSSHEPGWHVGLVHEWERCPSYAEVGEMVDRYLHTSEYLRFLLV